MNNPFEILDKRLQHIESMLLDIKHPNYSGNAQPIPTPPPVQEPIISNNAKAGHE